MTLSPPLHKKLGLKSQSNVYLLDCPDNYFDLLSSNPGHFNLKKRPKPNTIHFIHIFTTDAELLNRKIRSLVSYLKKDGMLWISWPKKSSSISSTIDKWSVMNIGQKAGLVDVKVASINEDWSALKFVYRLADR